MAIYQGIGFTLIILQTNPSPPFLKKVVSLKGETTFVLGGGAAFACWAMGQAGVSAA